MKLDGVSQLDVGTLKPSTGSSGITMNLGPNSGAAPLPASWTTRFDNVLCKASP